MVKTLRYFIYFNNDSLLLKSRILIPYDFNKMGEHNKTRNINNHSDSDTITTSHNFFFISSSFSDFFLLRKASKSSNVWVPGIMLEGRGATASSTLFMTLSRPENSSPTLPPPEISTFMLIVKVMGLRPFCGVLHLRLVCPPSL